MGKKYSIVSVVYSIVLILMLLLYPLLFTLESMGIINVNIQDHKKLFEGMFVLYIGILFIMSYLYKSKSFLFNSIICLLKNGLYPKGEWNALLMGLFCFALGIILVSSYLFSFDKIKIFGIIHLSTVMILISGFVIILLLINKICRKNINQD